MARKDFVKTTSCRFCHSRKITKVVNLGKMPLAGGFLKNKTDFKKEKEYPLEIVFCKKCFLAQVSVVINPDKIFKKYFYFSSKIQTLVDYFQKEAKSLKKTLKKGNFIVEIGCNDGQFLKALKANGFKALGVDPATNVVKPLIKKGMPIINDYFSEKLAKKIVKKYKKADAVYSFHSLAHIPDMIDIIKGIKILLKPEGYLAFEVQYVGDLLNQLQYDMVYHEHLHYYSLLTLKNFFRSFDMEIFNIKRSDVRAGSITYFVQNIATGKRKVNPKVMELEKKEKREKLNTPLPFISFNKKIQKSKRDLISIVNKLRSEKKIITAYGASGRGTIISNYCKLSNKLVDFVVDDSPAKQGSFMPGTHNPILSPKELLRQKIDYSIVFAWPFMKEVKMKNKQYLLNGGKFILPLPKVRIIK